MGTTVGCVIAGEQPPGPLPSLEAAHTPNLPGFPGQFVRAVQERSEVPASCRADTWAFPGRQEARGFPSQGCAAEIVRYPSGGRAPKGNVRALGSIGAHPTCVSPETGVTHAKDLLQESQSAWEEEPRPTQGRWDREEILGERAVQRPCSKMFLACMGTGYMQLEQSE